MAREYDRAKTEDDALLKKREATERQLERQRTLAEGRYDIITPPTPVKAKAVPGGYRFTGESHFASGYR